MSERKPDRICSECGRRYDQHLRWDGAVWCGGKWRKFNPYKPQPKRKGK